jgi:hypothetical protein
MRRGRKVSLNFSRDSVFATFLSFFQPARSARDSAPDFLGLANGTLFERDGFCFSVALDREDHQAKFTVMFQCRYSGRSVACVALRPAGSNLAIFSPRIECGPAGFGVAKFPAAIPTRHQGKWVTFEIGADVEYPLGQGREVRSRAGREVRYDTQFKRLPPAADVLPSRITKHVLAKTATIRLRLPSDVMNEAPDDAGHVEELWSLPGQAYSSRSA